MPTAALARHVDGYRRDDAPAAWAAHTEFHFALYRAAGSRWLLRLITPLWESSERYRLASLPRGRSLDERRREHERILEACITRDPDAGGAGAPQPPGPDGEPGRAQHGLRRAVRDPRARGGVTGYTRGPCS